MGWLIRFLRTARPVRDLLVTVLILGVSFGISLAVSGAFSIHALVPTFFVLAAFLISLLTDGYVYGILSALVGTIAVNYAFTFPYFALNFTIQENLVSAVIMLTVSVITCALTTKLKRMEAQRQEAEVERMRANLLRAVSHDLRTPLTTIYGSSSAILENGDALTGEQKTTMLRGIREDAEWLIRMVENLLSITRIGDGQVQIIKTPTVLEELIDAVLVKFRKRYPGQEVALEMPEDFVMVPVDAILIEQVITNLLENAVEHAEGMTWLGLRAALEGNQAVFEVANDGKGVPEDRMATLFTVGGEPAVRPSDGRKSNTGIGLSVCDTIIRAHGGTISARRRPGGGTVFRFTLNLEDAGNDEQ